MNRMKAKGPGPVHVFLNIINKYAFPGVNPVPVNQCPVYLRLWLDGMHFIGNDHAVKQAEPVMLASYMGVSISMEIRESRHRVAGRLQLPQELNAS